MLIAAAVAALWMLIVLVLHELRVDTLRAAEATGAHVVRLAAEYEGSSLRAIDLTLRQLRAEWLHGPAALDAAVTEHQALLEREGLVQVAIVDADGWTRYSRLPLEKRLNFADRDYFQLQKASSGDEMHISAPVIGRVTKRWAIQFSRPIRDGAGRFAGLIVVALPPPALETVYREMHLGADDVITLVRADGTILARTRDFDRARGISLARYPGLGAGEPSEGLFSGAGRLDGIERLIAYRKVPGYALTVYVGQSMAAVLAGYERQRNFLVGAGIVATLLLAALARVLASRRALREQLAVERERLMLELHDGSIQSIYAIGMELERARRQIGADPDAARHAVAAAVAQLNLVIQDLRSFIAGQSSAPHSEARFMAEMERIVAAAPDIVVDIDRSVVSALNPEQAQHVLRIAREGVSNVVRHAGAAKAELRLRRTAGAGARLEITDDGAGLPEGAQRSAGLGLHHIAARGQKLGGGTRVESLPGRGTRIVVDFPVHA